MASSELWVSRGLGAGACWADTPSPSSPGVSCEFLERTQQDKRMGSFLSERVSPLSFIYLFLNLFWAVLGLPNCMRAFPSCNQRASHCGGFCLGPQALGAPASVGVSLGLRCGPQAWMPRDVWNLPRTRDRTRVPCTGRRIPHPWAIGQTQEPSF